MGYTKKVNPRRRRRASKKTVLRIKCNGLQGSWELVLVIIWICSADVNTECLPKNALYWVAWNDRPFYPTFCRGTYYISELTNRASCAIPHMMIPSLCHICISVPCPGVCWSISVCSEGIHRKILVAAMVCGTQKADCMAAWDLISGDKTSLQKTTNSRATWRARRA